MQKKPDPVFSFFRISTQGLSYAPSKNGQIFDFLKNSRKIEGAKYKGAP